MNRLKKIIATLLLLCMTAELVAITKPVAAEASYDAGNGIVNVYNLDNDYKDGKYRFNQKFSYKKDFDDYYGLTVKNIYVANSSGKKVSTWKDQEILTKGGDYTIHFGVDFSKLPSDKYTLYFTVYSSYYGRTWNFKRSVNHNASKVEYSSAKYEVSTNGSKYVKVTYKVKALKGYTPKFEVFDEWGNKVYGRTCSTKISNADTTYSCSWNFYTSDGWKIEDGSYTFKLTVNGKTASKKINIKTN